ARSRVGNRNVPLLQQVAEVAGAHTVSGNGGVIGRALTDLRAFVIYEEEDLVFTVEDFGDIDGSAETKAVLVALERRAGSRRIEEILGIELLVAEELEGRAMRIIGAGLGREIDDGAHGAAVFGGVGIGLHLELLDEIHGGLHHFGTALRTCQFDRVVVEPVDQEVVLSVAHAAAAEPGITGSAERLDRSSGKQRQVVIAPPVQGQFHNSLVFDDLTLAGFDRIQQACRGGYFDVLGDTADLESEVDLGPLIDFQNHAGAGDGFEPGVLDLQPVFARQQEGGRVVAVLIGADFALGAGSNTGDGDARAGHNGAGSIDHASGNAGRLGVQTCGSDKKVYQPEKRWSQRYKALSIHKTSHYFRSAVRRQSR